MSHDIPVPKLLYQVDSFFNELYDRGLEITGTPEAKRRRERFYNLVQFLLVSSELDGLVAECGCWKGLSSFILSHYLKREKPSFDGEGYHIFDSFSGLSKPTQVDALSEALTAELTEKFGRVEGAYSASLPEVKTALAEFPKIEYHEGWIPSVFDSLSEGSYRFVHVDLDLYEPTRASIEYFYPRLVNGGLIVCDDYGSLLWSGARQAVDAYCTESGVPFIRVSTGQAVIWKRGPVVSPPGPDAASLRRSLAEARMELNRFQSEAQQKQITQTQLLGAEEKVKSLRVENKDLLAKSLKMRSERDEVKARLEEIRTKLLQMREERNEAKARARHFATRLAEVKEQLRRQQGETAGHREGSDT